VERPGPPVVALFFVLGLALGLLRGNALLLVPIAVGAAIPAGLTGGRSSARLRVGAAALFGTGVAVAAVYNIEYLPTYYVGLQLQDFLPSPVFRLAESVGLFHFGLA